MREVDPWYVRAACADVDPAIFLSDRSIPRKYRWSKARAICSTCPVLRECFEDAMSIPELPVWQSYQPGPGRAFAMFQAGFTPEELTDIYNQRESRKAA